MSPALSAPQSPWVPQQQPLCDDWKQEITERLGRYRAHRPQTAAQPVSPARAPVDSRATKIARAVASRYAATPTYSELLAAETARAEALAAEQRRAQRAEQAAAETAGNLFRDLEASDNVRPSPPTDSAETSASSSRPAEGEQAFLQRYGSAIVTQPMQPLALATAVMPHFAARSREMHLHQPEPEPEPSLEDLLASALIEPRALLPSKLIEFPRELVSSRRARPRLPEDPTREQASSFQEQPPAQLRIFEVQTQVEAQPEAEAAMGTDVEPPASGERNADEGTGASAQMSLSEIGEPGIADEVASGPVENRTPPPATCKYIREDAAAQRSATNASPPNVAANESCVGADLSSTGTAARKPAEGLSGLPASTANVSTAGNFRGLEWASISLDKEPATYSRRSQSEIPDYMPFMVDPASIDRRVMAFAVDFALVTAGFLAFLAVFVASTPHLPHGLTALALAGAVYIALWVLYQMLFFSLSGATAGMLYAHIALCTFDDQNPTRSALQWRVGTWWLSMLPLGVGFLWCFVDEDSLCWHDRITRTYQREY
ncbi:MAG: RDD family protein [Acidobacteriaceae bacterium]